MPRTSSRAFASFTLAAIVALSSAALAETGPLPSFVGTTVSQDALLEAMSSVHSRSFKPVGHTSVVLRMRTVERVTLGVNLRSREVPRGYQHELAAYRLSRLLGLDNVPPAIFRRVSWKEIRQRFHKDKLDRRESIRRAVLWDDDGTTPGAAIYWIKGLRSIGLEDRSKWTGWVGSAQVPEEQAALARDLSNMAVFDFLIGNWDRFSGGNLQTGPDAQRLYLRDNDRAFSTPLLERRYDTLLRGLTRTKRFSKSMLDGISALDESAIRAELAGDPSDSADPLLSSAQIADVLDRRATILSYLAALIEEHGAEQVLVFP